MLAISGIHLLVVGYLVLRSKYVPNVVGGLLVVAELGYIVDNFAVVLFEDESIDAVLTDERRIIEFEFGPSWLVVEPWDDEAVNVSKSSTLLGAQNPDKSLDIDTSRLVRERAWIDEVVTTAREFHDSVIEMNPELQPRDVMEEIRAEIDIAEELRSGSDRIS